jgi:hypothetical protein
MAPKPKLPTPVKTDYADVYNKSQQQRITNRGKTATPYTPEQKLQNRAAGDLVNKYTAAYHSGQSPEYLDYKTQALPLVRGLGALDAVPQGPTFAGPSYSGGGGGGRRGGGGRAVADVHAQAQMDYLTQLLGSQAYKTNPETYDTMRGFVNNASEHDLAASTASYDALDQYLGAHQSNPFADVALQSSGGAGDAGYGAFQNVLALLSGGQQAANQSRGAESQMARTYSGNQIGAMDNAYLFNISNQQAAAQQALDAERRQASMQLAQLIAQGATAPQLSALGFG